MSGGSFASLGLAPFLVKQCDMLLLTQPTEVQRLCIPEILQGKRHVVAGAVTGSGKTAAFALPMLQLLSSEMYGVFALVLTPSRELAYQILDQFVAFGAPMGLRCAVVIGGAPHGKQLEALIARPHVVVSTPGRLRMLLESFPEAQTAMRNLRFLVLDEADRLTENEMRHDTLAVVASLGTPKSFRKTLLFSATISDELVDCTKGLLPRLGIPNAETLAICSTASEVLAGGGPDAFGLPPTLRQHYLFVPNHVKMQYLVAVLRSREKNDSAIIFVNSCLRCEVVRLTLQLLGFPVASLNSLLTQQQRLNSLAMFKMGFAKFLIATDVASRGLDIPEVNLVVHYDFPKLASIYVHRVGRTARAGRAGDSVGLVTDGEVYLVHKLEHRTKSKMAKFSHPAVNEDAVLRILDDVSGAKVEARLTVKRDYSGDRVTRNKLAAAAKRSAINRCIRQDRKPQRLTESAPAESHATQVKLVKAHRTAGKSNPKAHV